MLPGTEGSLVAAAAREAPLIALRTCCVESSDELSIWDLTTNRPLSKRPVPRFHFSVGRFSPDATILALTDQHEIRLWAVPTLDLIDTLAGHGDLIAGIEVSPDGRTLASISRDGTLKLWDLAAREELLTLRSPSPARPPLRFAPDGRTLTFCSNSQGKDWICLLTTKLSEEVAAEQGP